MKTSVFSLGAFALMAAATTAQAQSSLTMYGKVDLGIVRSNNGADPSTWSMEQAQSSRLGFRGREDLGGGWRATFRIEHRFNPDTGAQTRPQFWRGRSSVGLETPYGELRLGRDKLAALDLSLYADAFEGDYQAGMGGQFTEVGFTVPSSTTGNDSRSDDGIFYTSPRFSGFRLLLGAAMSDGTATQRGRSIGLRYGGGPFSANVAYDTLGDGARRQNVLIANGFYKFGSFTLFGGFARGEILESNNLQDRNSVIVSGMYTFGSNELLASVGRTERDDVAALANRQDREATKFGIGYRYNFSKRTQLYTTAGSTSEERGGVKRARVTSYDLGITHDF